MKINEEYDADEILRDKEEDVPVSAEDPDSIDELDFENGRKNSYDELVSDLDDPGDLLE